MIRLLIVDDHVIVRQGLQQLFATVPGIEVVGLAADGDEAVVQVDRLRPDVVLMDIEMPRVDGVEATRRIATTHPTSRVVILTACADRRRIEEAVQAGAGSYVLKHSDPSQVVRAVHAAHRPGARPGSPATASDEPPNRDEQATAPAHREARQLAHAASSSDEPLPLYQESADA